MSEQEYSEEGWIADERNKVIDFLKMEDCRHAGVADWPVFYVDPHVALWAVQSTRHVGRVGWWAISGDVPTDYMSSSDGEHPRDALRYFSAQWRDVAGYLRRGERHPTIDPGDPADWPEIAEMLERRAQILQEYADDDACWDD